MNLFHSIQTILILLSFYKKLEKKHLLLLVTLVFTAHLTAVFAQHVPYLVKDINTHSSPESGGVEFFATMNGEVYFSAGNNRTIGNELWKTDGTTAGTVLVVTSELAPQVLILNISWALII